MNKLILNWEIVGSSIVFQAIDSSSESAPIDSWGLNEIVSKEAKPASIAPLIGLIDEYDEVGNSDGISVNVPFSIASTLNEPQTNQLGLPPAAPLRLKIQGQGILTSPNFKFKYQYIKTDGTPVMGYQRNGMFLCVAGQEYLLLNPLFDIVEGMDSFNKLTPKDMDERMLIWSELKENLPDDALVDNSLRSMNIVRADSFTLDLEDNDDFSPQLLHRSQKTNEDLVDEIDYKSEDALPKGPQKSFAKRFRIQSTARRRYTTEGNWYLVIPDQLQKALQIVREIQEKPQAEKRAFISNPTSVLKERLQEEMPESEIERFFEETPEFISARVSHLGVWEPKQNVYILSTGQKWLPDDVKGLGVIIEGGVYDVATDDVQSVYEQLRAAKEKGEPTIEYEKQQIPVTDEALERFEQLSVYQTSQVEKDDSGKNKGEKQKPVVPILFDNVEEVEYTAKKRKIRGEPGGLPSAISGVELFSHQFEGVKWLQEHWASGSTGALLADDMGLGKTLQTLTFLAWVQEQMTHDNQSRKPMLIVAPTGLLKNWEDEALMHLSSHGLGILFKAFGGGLSHFKSLSHNDRKQEFENSDWVLTTFETLRDKIRYFLPVEWGVVVYDEVQKIKNPSSRVTEMAKSIDAEFFLALTGTPVENRLGDLWSIIDAIAPGQLGSLRDFHNTYEVGDEVTVGENIADLRSLLTNNPKPIRMLRRMKMDHLKGLPEKKEFIQKVDMPAQQIAAYNEAVLPFKKGNLGKKGILEVLQSMRKISLIPDDIGPEGITDEFISSSARLTALINLLDQIHAKSEKVLIFIEFLSIQDALIPYLQQRYKMVKPPLRISGAVSGHTRKKYVDEFQNRPRDSFDIMLLSPKAGGVGLTLTAANNVIHLSRWWNPAVEDQCTDRAFRIGQEKAVNVYYPLAIHPQLQDSSFDINLHELLERKRQLSRELLSPPNASTDELGELLNASV